MHTLASFAYRTRNGQSNNVTSEGEGAGKLTLLQQAGLQVTLLIHIQWGQKVFSQPLIVQFSYLE